MVNAYFIYIIIIYNLLVNKRLDEWVCEESMDLAKLELPQKDRQTPLKSGAVNGTPARPESRPASPEKDVSVVCYES